jgi:hypothetical protein
LTVADASGVVPAESVTVPLIRTAVACPHADPAHIPQRAPSNIDLDMVSILVPG